MNSYEKLLHQKYAFIYDFARLRLPQYVIDTAGKYLPDQPRQVVDLGCGTGLSAEAWAKHGCKVIGVDIREDMLAVAESKNLDGVSFLLSDAADTGIESQWADVVLCSQSFQWMDQNRLQKEVKRILKPGGLFFVLRYFLMPIGSYEVGRCFFDFIQAVNAYIRRSNENVQPYPRKASGPDRESLLLNGTFRFAHSLSFTNSEYVTAERFVAMALSQGKVYSSMLHADLQLTEEFFAFSEAAEELFRGEGQDLEFSYTLDIGIYE